MRPHRKSIQFRHRPVLHNNNRHSRGNRIRTCWEHIHFQRPTTITNPLGSEFVAGTSSNHGWIQENVVWQTSFGLARLFVVDRSCYAENVYTSDIRRGLNRAEASWNPEIS